MKNRLLNIIECTVFCGFLAAMLLLYLFLPRRDYSDVEKRYLASKPELEAENILSGNYGSEAESYIADHLPGRDFFVSLASNFDRLSLRQTTKEIYVGKSGRLYERPETRTDRLESNVEAINRFAESLGKEVDLMVIPSSGYLLQEDIGGLADPYEDRELIQEIYSLTESGVEPFDLLTVLESDQTLEELFYRTDHHWTSRGAYSAYKAYASSKNRPVKAAEEFRVETVSDFRGTTYSRGAMWQFPGEELELWHSDTPFLVSDDKGESHEGLFYPENLEGEDKYTVFLGGNRSLVRIENNAPDAEGSLLIIRDSFSNSLGCFLAESYRTVVLVDLRYYKYPVSELCEAEQFDDILVEYSLKNFLTDSNIIWLE